MKKGMDKERVEGEREADVEIGRREKKRQYQNIIGSIARSSRSRVAGLSIMTTEIAIDC